MGMELMDKQAATVDDVLHEISRLRTAVKDAVDDGVKSAIKTMRKGRDMAEDVVDAAQDTLEDAKRAVKKNPLEAVGIVFAVGIIVGCLMGWAGSRRD